MRTRWKGIAAKAVHLLLAHTSINITIQAVLAVHRKLSGIKSVKIIRLRMGAYVLRDHDRQTVPNLASERGGCPIFSQRSIMLDPAHIVASSVAQFAFIEHTYE
jgi:hypothetical protein